MLDAENKNHTGRECHTLQFSWQVDVERAVNQYTEFIPKSAIPVNGRPVIAHLTEYLASLPEISEIIILSDFTGLGEQIRNYFGSSKVN